MTKLIETVEWLIARLDQQVQRNQVLEAQRDTWIRRAVSMATADDLAQWARDGGGVHDINLSEVSS